MDIPDSTSGWIPEFGFWIPLAGLQIPQTKITWIPDSGLPYMGQLMDYQQ